MRNILFAVVLSLIPVVVQRAPAQPILPPEYQTLLRHRIDGESTIVLGWGPNGMACELNSVQVSDLQTAVVDEGIAFVGGFIDDEPTIRGLISKGSEEGGLLIAIEGLGWDVVQVELDEEGDLTSAQVCRCSAVGPTPVVCSKGSDCDSNVGCGTGRYCQWRYAMVEPI